MNRHDLGVVLAAQLIECVNQRKYSHNSNIDHKYSHLTDDGKALMSDLIEAMVPVACAISNREIKEKASDLMVDSLKK